MKYEIQKDVEKKSGMSKQELQELLRHWQKKLLLTEWDLKIQIVDFLRKDYRQSGHFEVDLEKKTGVIQMTCDPFRDEEYILVHEMMHVVVWDFDLYTEKIILKNHQEDGEVHNWYLEHLEQMVHKLTCIALGREEKNRQGTNPLPDRDDEEWCQAASLAASATLRNAVAGRCDLALLCSSNALREQNL